LGDAKFAFLLLVGRFVVLEVEFAGEEGSEESLESLTDQEFSCIQKFICLLIGKRIFFDKLVVLAVHHVHQVTGADWPGDDWLLVIIDLTEPDEFLEDVLGDDVLIDFDLHGDLVTSSSPWPMNIILLIYSETSATRFDTSSFSSPIMTVNISSIGLLKYID
jgi:hypothetical protein